MSPTWADLTERPRYELRRVVQTQRTFANWPSLLRQMAGERIGRGGGELEFRTRDGFELSCPNIPGARLPIYEQYADDCYRLRDLLEPLQGRSIDVFDVGAHVGSFAINVARLHPRAQVECFEPSPQSLTYLRRNVTGNALDSRIRVNGVALAGREGTALLDDNDGASVHNGLMDEGAERLVHGADALARRHAIEVVTTTFDAAVAAAPAPPDVVKMDCEGGEYATVYGSSPASWGSVAAVVMEYHPVAGESWDELRDWFAGVGLMVTRHESRTPGLGTAWLARRG